MKDDSEARRPKGQTTSDHYFLITTYSPSTQPGLDLSHEEAKCPGMGLYHRLSLGIFLLQSVLTLSVPRSPIDGLCLRWWATFLVFCLGCLLCHVVTAPITPLLFLNLGLSLSSSLPVLPRSLDRQLAVLRTAAFTRLT